MEKYEYDSGYRKAVEDLNQAKIKEQAEVEKYAEELCQRLKQYLNDLVGKEFFGVPITQEISDGIFRFATNQPPIDFEKMTDETMKIFLFAQIQKTTSAKSWHEGYEKAFELIRRPEDSIPPGKMDLFKSLVKQIMEL